MYLQTPKMAKEEFNSLIVKPVSLAAGILGLIQGLAWTVFSILCICCHTNAIRGGTVTIYNGTEYYNYIYSIFLNGPDIADSPVLINPREFFIFMWFYLAFSVIWTVISGTVVWVMIHNKWPLIKHVFGGWSIITVLISIVDVVLTALIGRDLKTLDDFGTFPSVLVCYGIVMTMAARGYILWIANVIFAGILAKFVYNVIINESKETTMPIIHGYESSSVNPPWFNGFGTKDMWAEPTTPMTPVTPGSNVYQNLGFERSHSFFPATMNQSMENAYVDIPDNPRVPNNRPRNPPQESFAAAIANNANKVATIGRNKGLKLHLNNVPSPVIPEPDYTPPGTPNRLKSVLRSTSNY